jgi:hypothetical protein
MSIENPEEDINTEFVNMDVETNPDILKTAEENAAFGIAGYIVDQIGAGFAIIASPNLFYSDIGQPYPDAIGISINADIGLTKATLAPILRVLADNLEMETDKIQQFLKEATGNE